MGRRTLGGTDCTLCKSIERRKRQMQYLTLCRALCAQSAWRKPLQMQVPTLAICDDTGAMDNSPCILQKQIVQNAHVDLCGYCHQRMSYPHRALWPSGVHEPYCDNVALNPQGAPCGTFPVTSSCRSCNKQKQSHHHVCNSHQQWRTHSQICQGPVLR